MASALTRKGAIEFQDTKPITHQQKVKEGIKVGPVEKVQSACSKQLVRTKRPYSDALNNSGEKSYSVFQQTKKPKQGLEIQYLRGTEDHINAYVDCIDSAEEHVIIASWNLNFIPKAIFSSLMRAKKRQVSISFIVQSVKRKETLSYFQPNDDSSSDADSSLEYVFELAETKSHAKFLFVDSKTLFLGSYNALGDSYEESDDASFKISGTVEQLWPFYMSIYETYTAIGEDLPKIFDCIASISKLRYTKPRSTLQIRLDDQSKVFLLRTVEEHEEFFKLATPYNGDVSIYSPFSAKDNTLKRMQALDKLLPTGIKVSLKVLPKFKSGLTKILSQVPNLQNRVNIETIDSHQKVVILGEETLCLGSLNWLSAAQDAQAVYSRAELSLVLQGAKANQIIKKYYFP